MKIVEKFVLQKIQRSFQGYIVEMRRNRNLPGVKKSIDFVLRTKDGVALGIECNFYNVPGSKPMEIVRSYIELNEELKNNGHIFIWITDGPAWKKMQNALTRGMEQIDFILNTRIAIERFTKIIEALKKKHPVLSYAFKKHKGLECYF